MVDTSVWILALRPETKGSAVAVRVQDMLDLQQAAWCEIVRVELWNGVRNDKERDVILALSKQVITLPLSQTVWELACELGSKARRRGITVPATDLTIFACATVHGAELLTVDHHFDLMLRLP